MTNKLKTLAITALTPCMVLGQGVFPCAVESSNIGDKSRLLIAEAKAPPDSSPASAGVKLLRQIFQQLRNPQNQLALNYTTNRQLSAAKEAFQGALNPLLAIRPTEKSSNMNQALDAKALGKQARRDASVNGYANAKVAMAAPAQASYSGAGSMSYLQTATNATNSKDSAAATANAPTAASEEEARTLSDARAAAQQTNAPFLARAKKSRAEAPGAGGSAPASAPASAGLAPNNQRMLAQSMSRLMQSTKQMSQLTQAASETSVHNFGTLKNEMRPERTISTEPGGPLIQEFAADKLSSANSAREVSTTAAKGMDAEQSPLMKPESPSSYKIIHNQLLALLPPSVVGGIPLARLGASEKELAPTLTNKNIASKQVIDDWTIWTVKSSQTQRGAVQLYMRHSIVEAIRVFQPSYMGPEVGINIGDSLQTIKTKFGEPAFILDEPGSHSSSSNNYVYPLSHLAFQLAVSKAKHQVEVVSVLIFEAQ
ncbi:MAG TPA: hypothetical protein V6C86_27345 [Oculatellaceae cyanobacterium]